MNTTAASLLDYWFGPLDDPQSPASSNAQLWFTKSDETDAYILAHYGSLIEQAGAGELDAWCEEPSSCLALIILLDQFTRNVFRGSDKMYRFDARALQIANAAIDRGFDQRVHPIQAVFYYLPLEHAEDLASQTRSVLLFSLLKRQAPPASREQFEGFYDYALAHRDVVARFGRFPHRNAILGRASTEAERYFLERPGSSF